MIYYSQMLNGCIKILIILFLISSPFYGQCQDEETEFSVQLSNLYGFGFAYSDQFAEKLSGAFEFGMLAPGFMVTPYPDNFSNMSLTFGYAVFSNTLLKFGWYFGAFRFKNFKNELGYLQSPCVSISRRMFKNKLQVEIGALINYPENIHIYHTINGVKNIEASLGRNLDFPFPFLTLRFPLIQFTNDFPTDSDVKEEGGSEL